MQVKRILIIGNYGAGNLGDDAIFAGIIEELGEAGYKGEIELTHGGNSSSQDIYKHYKKNSFAPLGIRSRLKSTRSEAAEAIKRADLVILGGGGLFVDTESIKAPLIWSAQAKLCQKLGIPYICFGQSVGPLKHKYSQRLANKVFSNAQAIHVRDSDSANLLKSIGVKKDITVGTDPAFAWLEKSSKTNTRRDILAISLREWPSIPWSDLLMQIKSYAKDNALKPVLIAMDITNESEINHLKQTGLEVEVPKSATEALEFIASSKFAITMRLHASIFAAASNTPFLALSYSSKVKSLFESLSLQGSKVINSQEELQKTLASISQPKLKVKEGLEKNQDFLKALFEGQE